MKLCVIYQNGKLEVRNVAATDGCPVLFEANVWNAEVSAFIFSVNYDTLMQRRTHINMNVVLTDKKFSPFIEIKRLMLEGEKFHVYVGEEEITLQSTSQTSLRFDHLAKAVYGGSTALLDGPNGEVLIEAEAILEYKAIQNIFYIWQKNQEKEMKRIANEN